MRKRPPPQRPKNVMRAIARVLADNYHNHQLCSLRAKIDGEWRTLPIIDWIEDDEKTVFMTAVLTESGRFEVLQFVDDENRVLSESRGPVDHAAVSFSYTINLPKQEVTCGIVPLSSQP